MDGGDPVRLVDNADIGPSGGATWSPDGSQVAYVSADGGRREIWTGTTDGGEAVALTSGASAAAGEASVRWSPDGAHIAFVSDAGGQKKVWIVPAAGGNTQVAKHNRRGGYVHGVVTGQRAPGHRQRNAGGE